MSEFAGGWDRYTARAANGMSIWRHRCGMLVAQREPPGGCPRCGKGWPPERKTPDRCTKCGSKEVVQWLGGREAFCQPCLDVALAKLSRSVPVEIREGR